MKKASLHGLAFRNDVDLDGDVFNAPVTNSYRKFMYGIYHWFSAPYYRPIAEAPKVVVDGRLMTGQNPASAGPMAKELLAALKKCG